MEAPKPPPRYPRSGAPGGAVAPRAGAAGVGDRRRGDRRTDRGGLARPALAATRLPLPTQLSVWPTRPSTPVCGLDSWIMRCESHWHCADRGCRRFWRRLATFRRKNRFFAATSDGLQQEVRPADRPGGMCGFVVVGGAGRNTRASHVKTSWYRGQDTGSSATKISGILVTILPGAMGGELKKCHRRGAAWRPAV